MRPVVVSIVLLLALGLLGIIALLSRETHKLPASSPAAGGDFPVRSALRPKPPERRTENLPSAKADQRAESDAQELKTVDSTVRATNEVLANFQSSAALQNSNHSEYVSQQIETLNDLAMNDDSGSLNKILVELTNADKEIRKAALGAVIQFGGRSAISTLQELAAQTEDAAEKDDILAAITFLKLPSVFDTPATPGVTSAAAEKALPQTMSWGSSGAVLEH